jgi:NAD(P)-dependent dehydrogenase (short-subunit alcohol dehydrogenase family)
MLISGSLIVLSLFSIYILYYFRKVLNSPKSPIKSNMTGKIVIVTGANSGIGYETSKELLQQGARVIFASRNKELTQDILAKLNNSNAEYIHLDLSIIESIQSFVAEFRQKYGSLDILVNNAFNLRGDYTETPAGFENTVGTNYIGHLMLTIMLLPMFRPQGRIITVSSLAFDWVETDKDYIKHRMMNVGQADYNLWKQYSISKLCISSFAQHLAGYLEHYGLSTKSVFLHPGFVNTPAFLKVDKWYVQLSYYAFYPFIWYFYKDQYMGAQTVLYLCYLPYEELTNGAYYAECKLSPISPEKRSQELINTVMKYTSELVFKKVTVDKIPKEVNCYLTQCITN